MRLLRLKKAQVAHLVRQTIEHAQRPKAYRAARLTQPEAALAHKEHLVRFTEIELIIIVDTAKGIADVTTAKKINRTPGSTANRRTSAKNRWQDHFY